MADVSVSDRVVVNRPNDPHCGEIGEVVDALQSDDRRLLAYVVMFENEDYATYGPGHLLVINDSE